MRRASAGQRQKVNTSDAKVSTPDVDYPRMNKNWYKIQYRVRHVISMSDLVCSKKVEHDIKAFQNALKYQMGDAEGTARVRRSRQDATLTPLPASPTPLATETQDCFDSDGLQLLKTFSILLELVHQNLDHHIHTTEDLNLSRSTIRASEFYIQLDLEGSAC
ncbi:hypothetical protein H4Q26_010110 [Puccinia striiformis f. sp. tritici PST-130]|nr:hypothetical protein H4Q26_010110 [Puccinia striiformis f. sp. tritici PST-130]